MKFPRWLVGFGVLVMMSRRAWHGVTAENQPSLAVRSGACRASASISHLKERAENVDGRCTACQSALLRCCLSRDIIRKDSTQDALLTLMPERQQLGYAKTGKLG